jgi:HNH endonuclease
MKIPVGRTHFAIIDDEDYELVSQYHWHYHEGYARSLDCPQSMMHRLINKTPEGLDTDHINRDRSDNRKANLRSVTRSINGHNRDNFAHNRSGVKGVGYHKFWKKWRARITVNGKTTQIGWFKTKDEAAEALAEYRRKVGVSFI